jgi:uncharacterized phage protein (TIGR02218 family)
VSFSARERSAYGGQPLECFRFSQGANVWRYTSADRTVTITPGTFTPEAIDRDEIDNNQEEGSGNLVLRLPRTNPVVQLYLDGALPATPTLVTMYQAHRGDAEVVSPFSGVVGGVAFEDMSKATLTCSPAERTFRRSLPILTYQRPCNWALYSADCGVAKLDFRDVVTVLGVSGAVVTAAEFALRADGWFTGGYLEDPATGEVHFVVKHIGSTVTLMNAFHVLAPGATLHAFAGCDRSEATCASKFSNLVNHLGFARVPQRNPYSGAVS